MKTQTRWKSIGAWLVSALTGLFMYAQAVQAQNVTVFAAASLKDALDEIDGLHQKRLGQKTLISYAASSALARQIENGAPADIFISADLDWMDYLEKRKLLKTGTRVNLLRNELVLIAPADSKTSLTIGPNFPLAAHLGNRRLSMADPDSVPAGKYGKAALEHLGVWSSVSDKIARAENVRAALRFVARAEAPFGIVYRTDAAAEKNVRMVAAFPANTHPPIVYPAALLATGKSPAANQYFGVLKSPEAMNVFRKHGFIPYRSASALVRMERGKGAQLTTPGEKWLWSWRRGSPIA
jgi:molybdate transport system substrate-binding protein